MIGLNAIFMFLGVWVTKFRMVSTYMNFGTCML